MAKEKTTKINFKTPAILEGAKAIEASLKTSRIAIEAMPMCTLRKALMTSQVAFEKKINTVVKKELIAKALSAIRKDPSIINSLPEDIRAAFAQNPETAISKPEISENVEVIKAVGADVKKAKKPSK